MKLQLKAYSTDGYKSMKDMYYWAQLVGKKKKNHKVQVRTVQYMF